MTPRRIWPAIGLLLVVVGLLYIRAIWFGTSKLDDPMYILGRPEVLRWWEAPWRQRLLTPETGYPTPLPTVFYVHLRALNTG